MKRTRKLAMAAMLCALGVVLLYLGSIIEVLDLTMIAIASVFIFFAVIEMGDPYPYLIHLVTSFLALILLPSKFAAVMYLLFGGIYPILKAMFEKLHPLVSWVVKFSYFNTFVTALILVSRFVLHMEGEDVGFTVGFYGLANLTFFLYDLAMTKLVTLYLVKLRRRLRVEKYFGK